MIAKSPRYIGDALKSPLQISRAVKVDRLPHRLPIWSGREFVRTKIDHWWVVQRPLHGVARTRYNTQYRCFPHLGNSRLSTTKCDIPRLIFCYDSSFKYRHISLVHFNTNEKLSASDSGN